MKKVLILLTLFAFVTAGAYAVNKTQAKVTKEVKIEMLKLNQDPVKAKEVDKTKKTDKATAAPSLKSAAEQKNTPANNVRTSEEKPNLPPAKKEASTAKPQDPPKK
jgi:hypothetical protein